MSLQIAPPPLGTPVVSLDRKAGFPGEITSAWADYIQLVLLNRLQSSAFVVKSVPLTAQHAAVGATALEPSAASAVYRVSWYLRITTVDPVSSSATVSIGSTDGGIPISQSGAAVTGNTTATVQSGSVLVRADPSSPITYSVAYASNTPGTMQYRLDIILETVA